MARKFINNYRDKKQTLLKLYKNNDEKALASEIAKMSKQLNRRFLNLERKGVGLNENAYRYAQQETGRDRPRYSESPKLWEKNIALYGAERVLDAALNINIKLVSNSSLVTGVEALSSKRIHNAVEKLKKFMPEGLKKELDEEDFLSFIKSGGSKLLNSKYLSSSQVIEDFLRFSKRGNGELSNKEFIDSYIDYLKNNLEDLDMLELRRELRKKNNLKKMDNYIKKKLSNPNQFTKFLNDTNKIKKKGKKKLSKKKRSYLTEKEREKEKRS